MFFFEAFRPGVVDMDEAVANVHAITLPETAFEGELEITLPEAISFELVFCFVELFFLIIISAFLSYRFVLIFFVSTEHFLKNVNC